jgi:hypothetical protein
MVFAGHTGWRPHRRLEVGAARPVSDHVRQVRLRARKEFTMNFDPAITAWQAFVRVQASHELGEEELEAAIAAQERFSTGTGEEVSAAYRELVEIGSRHPEAAGFSEFLVYTTWCHLMDETVPEHFQRGAALCRALLQRAAGWEAERLQRLRAMERSFRAGLGEKAEDVMDYDADTLKSGD